MHVGLQAVQIGKDGGATRTLRPVRHQLLDARSLQQLLDRDQRRGVGLQETTIVRDIAQVETLRRSDQIAMQMIGGASQGSCDDSI